MNFLNFGDVRNVRIRQFHNPTPGSGKLKFPGASTRSGHQLYLATIARYSDTGSHFGYDKIVSLCTV